MYCLTASHRQTLLERLAPGKGKHLQLLDPDGRDVIDPIGGSLSEYEDCARFIAEAIERQAVDWA